MRRHVGRDEFEAGAVLLERSEDGGVNAIAKTLGETQEEKRVGSIGGNVVHGPSLAADAGSRTRLAQTCDNARFEVHMARAWVWIAGIGALGWGLLCGRGCALLLDQHPTEALAHGIGAVLIAFAVAGAWRLWQLEADARPIEPGRASFTVELVPMHYPPERCDRCRALLRPSGEERMWLRLERGRARYLHERCADARGEPLP